MKLQNIRSLFEKLKYVNNLIILENIDIFFLTETWLNSRITDSMINLTNYEIKRSDRLNKMGGGVAIYFKNSLNIHELTKPIVSTSFSNFEFISVKLVTADTSLIFLCFYIPPNSSSCPHTIENVCKVISFYIKPTKPFVLLGDFNLPNINWNTLTARGISSNIFLNFCNNNGLTQLISSPTHCHGNVLDLVLCNISATGCLITHSVDCPTSLSCDHNSISLMFSGTTSVPTKSNKSYKNFKKANYTKINQILAEQNWNFLNTPQSFQNHFNMFISILLEIINRFVPTTTHSNTHKSSFPRYIRRLLNVKLKTYRLYKMGKCTKEEYKASTNKYETEVKKWHEKIENNICNNPNTNKFYSYANKKLQKKFTIPPLINPTGEQITCNLEKATLLNQTFFKSFSNTTTDPTTNFSPFSKDSPLMPDFVIHESDLLEAVYKTKDKLSFTPEDIPPYFIKRIIHSIKTPLLFLFNSSLKYNYIPYQWKQSLITPIFKKGDRRIPLNYRPIALTSSFSRILESIITNKILNHLLTNNLILPNQFGFLPHRSSGGQLLSCLEKWNLSFCSNSTNHVAYTDIRKAFDTVSHSKLIMVLKSFGLNSSILNWIQNFLSGRSQTVKIDSCFSPQLPVLSGVPQGSVLGPILFLMFINDIIQKVQSFSHQSVNFALFADDTKIFSSDPDELQSSLNIFSKTTAQFQLELAPNKCFVLPICKSAKLQSHPNFSIDSTILSLENNANDLGVTISSNLKWEQHINKISQQASFISYQIIKSFKSKNIWTLLKLYKSYVRPKLEYCTQVWSPFLKKDIEKIEKIQKRFTKQICRRCNIPFVSYSDRLIKLDLLSLEHRRIIFDVITMYKLINNQSDLNFNSYFHFQDCPYTFRNQTRKVKPNNYFNCNTWNGSFFERGPKYWNNVPYEISKANNINTFKIKLRTVPLDCLMKTY